MRITSNHLRRLIREELQRAILNENDRSLQLEQMDVELEGRPGAWRYKIVRAPAILVSKTNLTPDDVRGVSVEISHGSNVGFEFALGDIAAREGEENYQTHPLVMQVIDVLSQAPAPGAAAGPGDPEGACGPGDTCQDGDPHPDHPNVVWNQPTFDDPSIRWGWIPAPGYEWVDSDPMADSWEVKPEAGAPTTPTPTPTQAPTPAPTPSARPQDVTIRAGGGSIVEAGIEVSIASNGNINLNNDEYSVSNSIAGRISTTKIERAAGVVSITGRGSSLLAQRKGSQNLPLDNTSKMQIATGAGKDRFVVQAGIYDLNFEKTA